MIDIQRDVARLAVQAGELKQAVVSLIEEISRDHYDMDSDTEWLIAIGDLPCSVAFRLKGLLEILVEEEFVDLESELRAAAGVDGIELLREWTELQRCRELRETVKRSHCEANGALAIQILMAQIPFAIGWN